VQNSNWLSVSFISVACGGVFLKSLITMQATNSFSLSSS